MPVPLVLALGGFRIEATFPVIDDMAITQLEVYDPDREDLQIMHGSTPAIARSIAYRRTVTLEAPDLRDLERFARDLQALRDARQVQLVADAEQV